MSSDVHNEIKSEWQKSPDIFEATLIYFFIPDEKGKQEFCKS